MFSSYSSMSQIHNHVHRVRAHQVLVPSKQVTRNKLMKTLVGGLVVSFRNVSSKLKRHLD